MRFQKIRAALLALVICTGVLSTTVFAYVDESRVEHLKNCTLSKPERIKAMIDQKVGKITKKEIMDAHPDISKTTVERTLADFHKLFIYLISYTDEVDIFTMTEIIKQKIVSGCKNPFRTFYIAVMHYGVWLLIFCERSRCKCTSLQREANRALGYTGQQTLDYTQNLYEKKLVTYPRADSRFLTKIWHTACPTS